MNNDILLNTILSAVSINGIIENMDDSQKNKFLREIFDCIRSDIEWTESDINLCEDNVSFVKYDEESNSIIVSKTKSIAEYPIGYTYHYKISIDKLQNTINSLVNSKQTKTR